MLELLLELARLMSPVVDTGDTNEELLAAVLNPMRAVTETDFGPVIRASSRRSRSTPRLGDPFRATVVEARRARSRAVVRRGIERGDLRPDADPDVATELLVDRSTFG